MSKKEQTLARKPRHRKSPYARHYHQFFRKHDLIRLNKLCDKNKKRGGEAEDLLARFVGFLGKDTNRLLDFLLPGRGIKYGIEPYQQKGNIRLRCQKLKQVLSREAEKYGKSFGELKLAQLNQYSSKKINSVDLAAYRKKQSAKRPWDQPLHFNLEALSGQRQEKIIEKRYHFTPKEYNYKFFVKWNGRGTYGLQPEQEGYPCLGVWEARMESIIEQEIDGEFQFVNHKTYTFLYDTGEFRHGYKKEIRGFNFKEYDLSLLPGSTVYITTKLVFSTCNTNAISYFDFSADGAWINFEIMLL